MPPSVDIIFKELLGCESDYFHPSHVAFLFREMNNFLICFPMDYRDFSVKSNVIISLFQLA